MQSGDDRAEENEIGLCAQCDKRRFSDKKSSVWWANIAPHFVYEKAADQRGKWTCNYEKSKEDPIAYCVFSKCEEPLKVGRCSRCKQQRLTGDSDHASWRSVSPHFDYEAAKQGMWTCNTGKGDDDPVDYCLFVRCVGKEHEDFAVESSDLAIVWRFCGDDHPNRSNWLSLLRRTGNSTWYHKSTEGIISRIMKGGIEGIWATDWECSDENPNEINLCGFSNQRSLKCSACTKVRYFDEGRRDWPKATACNDYNEASEPTQEGFYKEGDRWECGTRVKNLYEDNGDETVTESTAVVGKYKQRTETKKDSRAATVRKHKQRTETKRVSTAEFSMCDFFQCRACREWRLCASGSKWYLMVKEVMRQAFPDLDADLTIAQKDRNANKWICPAETCYIKYYKSNPDYPLVVGRSGIVGRRGDMVPVKCCLCGVTRAVSRSDEAALGERNLKYACVFANTTCEESATGSVKLASALSDANYDDFEPMDPAEMESLDQVTQDDSNLFYTKNIVPRNTHPNASFGSWDEGTGKLARKLVEKFDELLDTSDFAAFCFWHRLHTTAEFWINEAYEMQKDKIEKDQKWLYSPPVMHLATGAKAGEKGEVASVSSIWDLLDAESSVRIVVKALILKNADGILTQARYLNKRGLLEVTYDDGADMQADIDKADAKIPKSKTNTEVAEAFARGRRTLVGAEERIREIADKWELAFEAGQEREYLANVAWCCVHSGLPDEDDEDEDEDDERDDVATDAEVERFDLKLAFAILVYIAGPSTGRLVYRVLVGTSDITSDFLMLAQHDAIDETIEGLVHELHLPVDDAQKKDLDSKLRAKLKELEIKPKSKVKDHLYVETGKSASAVQDDDTKEKIRRIIEKDRSDRIKKGEGEREEETDDDDDDEEEREHQERWENTLREVRKSEKKHELFISPGAMDKIKKLLRKSVVDSKGARKLDQQVKSADKEQKAEAKREYDRYIDRAVSNRVEELVESIDEPSAPVASDSATNDSVRQWLSSILSDDSAEAWSGSDLFGILGECSLVDRWLAVVLARDFIATKAVRRFVTGSGLRYADAESRPHGRSGIVRIQATCSASYFAANSLRTWKKRRDDFLSIRFGEWRTYVDDTHSTLVIEIDRCVALAEENLVSLLLDDKGKEDVHASVHAAYREFEEDRTKESRYEMVTELGRLFKAVEPPLWWTRNGKKSMYDEALAAVEKKFSGGNKAVTSALRNLKAGRDRIGAIRTLYDNTLDKDRVVRENLVRLYNHVLGCTARAYESMMSDLIALHVVPLYPMVNVSETVSAALDRADANADDPALAEAGLLGGFGYAEGATAVRYGVMMPRKAEELHDAVDKMNVGYLPADSAGAYIDRCFEELAAETNKDKMTEIDGKHTEILDKIEGIKGISKSHYERNVRPIVSEVQEYAAARGAKPRGLLNLRYRNGVNVPGWLPRRSMQAIASVHRHYMSMVDKAPMQKNTGTYGKSDLWYYLTGNRMISDLVRCGSGEEAELEVEQSKLRPSASDLRFFCADAASSGYVNSGLDVLLARHTLLSHANNVPPDTSFFDTGDSVIRNGATRRIVNAHVASLLKARMDHHIENKTNMMSELRDFRCKLPIDNHVTAEKRLEIEQITSICSDLGLAGGPDERTSLMCLYLYEHQPEADRDAANATISVEERSAYVRSFCTSLAEYISKRPVLLRLIREDGGDEAGPSFGTNDDDGLAAMFEQDAGDDEEMAEAKAATESNGEDELVLYVEQSAEAQDAELYKATVMICVNRALRTISYITGAPMSYVRSECAELARTLQPKRKVPKKKNIAFGAIDKRSAELRLPSDDDQLYFSTMIKPIAKLRCIGKVDGDAGAGYPALVPSKLERAHVTEDAEEFLNRIGRMAKVGVISNGGRIFVNRLVMLQEAIRGASPRLALESQSFMFAIRPLPLPKRREIVLVTPRDAYTLRESQARRSGFGMFV
jgi:hypothetical protein